MAKTRRVEPKHPKTGEPTNAARAARVDAALVAYAEDTGTTDEPPETVAQDFMTDILHWLALRDLDGTTPSEVAGVATRMFEDEVASEAPEAEAANAELR